jgi:hypothetical protein
MGEGRAEVSVVDTGLPLKVLMYFPRLSDQQRVFRHFDGLVKRGAMTFPKQVVAELNRPATGDMASLWSQGALRYRRYAEPPDAYVRDVLRRASRRSNGRTITVLDPTKTREDADPYVVAQALFLNGRGFKAAVITNDALDNENRLSVVTACEMLGLRHMRSEQFLRAQALIV